MAFMTGGRADTLTKIGERLFESKACITLPINAYLNYEEKSMSLPKVHGEHEHGKYAENI